MKPGDYGRVVRSIWWVEDGAGGVRPSTMLEAGALYKPGDVTSRRVGWDESDDGEIVVSTVFLAIDHAFGDEPGPVLYETMVRRGGEWDHQVRYRTRAEALAGHAAACREHLGREPRGGA